MVGSLILSDLCPDLVLVVYLLAFAEQARAGVLNHSQEPIFLRWVGFHFSCIAFPYRFSRLLNKHGESVGLHTGYDTHTCGL